MRSTYFLISFLFFFNAANASDCPDRPVGFGFASLEEIRNSLNKSYDVKLHCERHKEALTGLAKQETDAKLMDKSVVDSQVIILGEEHTTPSQRDYGQVFNNLKKNNSRINCLFLEWNPSDVEAQKMIQGQKPESYMYLQHFEIVAAALKSQTKVFAVDGRDQSKKYEPGDLANYVRNSNAAIFGNIKKLVDSGTCAAGVLLVGKAHVEHPQLVIDPKDSLKTFFEKNGTPVVAINLVYTGKNEYADNVDQQWQWNICPDDPVTALKSQIVVSRDRLNKTDAIAIDRVRSYDYFLFMPEVEQKRLYP